MGEPVPDTQPATRPAEDRLDSWTEIAAHLDRDVTTVQHWERSRAEARHYVRKLPRVFNDLG